MLSKHKFIVLIVRFRGIITFFYEILIITLFYFINGFKFENNISLLFIFLVLLVPVVFMILSKVMRKQNQQFCQNIKTPFDNILDEEIENGHFEKKFIDVISKEVPNISIRESSHELLITCGRNKNINIYVKNTKTQVAIEGTHIVYQYIYNFKDDDISKYDQKGISRMPRDRFYKMLVDKVLELANKKFEYIEYYISKNYIGCALLQEGQEIYKIISLPKKKRKRFKEVKQDIET